MLSGIGRGLWFVFVLKAKLFASIPSFLEYIKKANLLSSRDLEFSSVMLLRVFTRDDKLGPFRG